MGGAASTTVHHISELKELYEREVNAGATDAELLAACKEFIESDKHCYRSEKHTGKMVRKKGNKTPHPHLHPEPSMDEMARRIQHAEEDLENDHEAPHPTQVKPCDDGYIITCGSDGYIDAPGIGVINESINLSGTYHAAQGKYHTRKDLYLKQPTHINEDKTHWLQAQLSFETGGENPGWRLSHILHWTNVFGESVTDSHTLYYTIHKRKDHAPPMGGWKVVNAMEENILPSFEPIHPPPDHNPTKEWQKMYI